MPHDPAVTGADRYLVVARRYRPQSFDSLIGQEPIVRTLRNAITSNRIGHAYLFTGSRGVGKTSAARIFAKALNCQHGPTLEPCNACDSCLAVSTGDDLDVLEIDGASNRGIDEVRQLRGNVGIRPSRSRYKIYIIDEVHMLSRDAFNALLKTLEEPPGHVKFIFCTTDVEKVPVTVISRCQRFDFAPIRLPVITQRLAEIARQEGAQADPEALALLARRAEGSLRDSQSLLEQVLSSTSDPITVETIHQLLGTARQQQVAQVMEALLARQAAVALQNLDEALTQGVDVGQFAEQLLTLMRDTMAVGVGCSSEVLLGERGDAVDQLRGWADRWGVATLLSTMQILETTLAKMRLSSHRRALLEIALVQIAHLEQLVDLAQLAAQFPREPLAGRGETTPVSPVPATKKKDPDDIPLPAASPVHVLLTTESAQQVWETAVGQLHGLSSDFARKFLRVELLEPGRLRVVFESPFHRERCEREELKQRLLDALRRITGESVELRLDTVSPAGPSPAKASTTSRGQRMAASYAHPVVREAVELFDAEITDVRSP